MSHSAPRRTRNGASPLVRGGDLLRLAPQRVGVEAGHDANVRGVVADREVLVTAVARGRRHLEHRVLSVRPRRVAVQVSADVRLLDERRRVSTERRLSQLGRHPGDVEPGVHLLLRRRHGQRLERRDVGLRAGRPEEVGPEALRQRRDELDGIPLDGDADRVPFVTLDHRHDRGLRHEPFDCVRRP